MLTDIVSNFVIINLKGGAGGGGELTWEKVLQEAQKVMLGL